MWEKISGLISIVAAVDVHVCLWSYLHMSVKLVCLAVYWMCVFVHLTVCE